MPYPAPQNSPLAPIPVCLLCRIRNSGLTETPSASRLRPNLTGILRSAIVSYLQLWRRGTVQNISLSISPVLTRIRKRCRLF